MASSSKQNNNNGDTPFPTVIDSSLAPPSISSTTSYSDHQPPTERGSTGPADDINTVLETSGSQKKEGSSEYVKTEDKASQVVGNGEILPESGVSHNGKALSENHVSIKPAMLKRSASALQNGNDDEQPSSDCADTTTSQVLTPRNAPHFHNHHIPLFSHDAYFVDCQGEPSNFSSGANGLSTSSSQQPWMNPALLLNPTGKHRNAVQPGPSANGSPSGPSPQSNLTFEFTNTNGNSIESDPRNQFNSDVQYSNLNHPSPSNLLAPSNSHSFSGHDPSASPYSIPHHMSNVTNSLPNSPLHSLINSPPNGMGSMIERMNNVQDRSTVPVAKRQKMMSDDDGEGGRKNGFSTSSSGILSGYVKDKQREAQAEGASASGKAHALLDLTGDDDDAAPVVKDPKEEEVCFGMIAGASVNCHIVPSPKPGSRTLTPGSWPQVKVVLRRLDGDKTRTINVVDHTRIVIGKLNDKIAKGLIPLIEARLLGIRTDAMIGTRRRLPDEEAGKPISRSYNLQLMLYGKQKHARTIARHFSQPEVGLNLLSPTRVDKGIRVFNPLAKENRPVPVPRTYEAPPPPPVVRTEEQVRADIFSVFDTLTDTEQLPESEPDARVMTPLLKHQKQALYFMKGREDPTESLDQLWKKNVDARGQTAYYNVITNQRSYSPPAKAQGGILADMMGLGKTLSILSLLASTSPDSVEWANTPPDHPDAPDQSRRSNSFQPPQADLLGLTKVKRNAKATLLICPLSTITNWEEQIKQHIRPGGLTYHIYHGPNRTKELSKLANFDLVITTYGSVSSELSARVANKATPKPLEEIGWFRIVLDEAHMIREQTTLQFKAICRLQASRRWAVTGTPVQNKLDDLGSLLAFLRIKPFHDRTVFNQHIVQPFKICDEGVVPKLRLLVDTITLRRMKDKINIPARHDQLVKLQFSAEERRLYDAFSKDAALRVSVLAGRNDRLVGGNKYIHILKAILRLRLYCSGGKDLLSEGDMRVLEGMSSEAPIDIDSDDEDEKPELTETKAYDMYNLMQDTGGDSCIVCNQKLGVKETASIESERQEEVIGHMTPCYHLLCTSCVPTFGGVCPCGVAALTTLPLRSSRANQEHEARAEAKGIRGNGKAGKTGNAYSGPNTKVQFLTKELRKWKEMSEKNPDEAPYKSVVFSQWTTNLDLIEQALQNEDISFVRLDGKMARQARTRVMDSFREDPEVQVILVSIMAGSLGLNLTAGNSVYIMEPLYNPAAEAQAIDRVHRLGQKREVYCVRLLMADSFEEKMRELQEKKMKLAALSMDRNGGGYDEAGHKSKSMAAKQRLEDLRSLFEKGGKL